MSRFRSSVRRIAAIAGAAFVGIVVSLVIASPASAHHSAVEGLARCDTATGEWVVTWTVKSYAPSGVNHYKFVQVEVLPAGSSVPNIAVTDGDNYPHDAHASLTGELRLPGSSTEATLTVRAKWENGFEEGDAKSRTVTFGGSCVQDQPKPNAAFESLCDGTVTVTLTNAQDAKAPAAFAVTGGAGFSQNATVQAGGSKEIIVPAGSAGQITVTVAGQKLAEYAWEQPADCAPAKVASRSDCDSLTVSVENPEGTRPVDAIVTHGGKTETLAVAPGETKETTFDADAATVATVKIGDKAIEIPWKKPADCGSPGLPVTGASVGGAIAAGIALVGVGAGLIVLTRRRRRTVAA